MCYPHYTFSGYPAISKTGLFRTVALLLILLLMNASWNLYFYWRHCYCLVPPGYTQDQYEPMILYTTDGGGGGLMVLLYNSCCCCRVLLLCLLLCLLLHYTHGDGHYF